jgi:anti-sigma factor RsiW
MNCNESRPLIDANSDGELDLIRHLELEAHLHGCAACTALADAARARSAALRAALPRFTAPPLVVERIRTAFHREDAPRAAAGRGSPIIWPIWNFVGMAAALALAVIGGFSWGSARARSRSLFGEAFSDHVRSLQANHLMDVVSTDQHTVKPWFVGKLEFSPPVADLADLGFPLVGGRLEHMGGRSAAALVFRRRQHVINVFIWPGNESPVGVRADREGGYAARSWSRAGLNFMAVSEIPANELDQFVGGFRGRTD